MPETEPNKKWDALLRAYAKKQRRDVELHPVSRRALQDEVKKTFGTETGRGEKRSLLTRWWFRAPLAGVFAACAVMLSIQNRRFEETKGLDRRMTPLTAAKAPESAATLDLVKAKPMVTAGGTIGGGGFGGANVVARSASPLGAAAGSFRQLQAYDNLTQNARSSFQNNISGQKVLNSFLLDRSGDRVLVTDKDGSVYSGQVLAAKTETAAGYSFAVHGVNNSIQQAVDFKGRFDTVPNQAQNVNGYVSNAANQTPQARISGTATVGATNQFRVEAAPAP